MAVETVFGITQAGRPCRICLRMGGYCHHHVSQQPTGGYCVPSTPQRQQPVEERHGSNQRVFGYTQRGLPCKICLKRGDYCHFHESQRDGSCKRSSAEVNRDEIHYGITLKGLPCKICIRKGGFCRMHEGQRQQQRESPPPPPRGESYPSSSPRQETRRISPSPSPQQGTRRSASQQNESRRVTTDNTRSPRRSPRPGRVHNVERQRQIYGNNVERREQNVEREAETTQARNSSRHRRRSEGRQVTTSNSNAVSRDARRSSSLPRRTARRRSTQEHARSSSAAYRSSPERQSGRRSGGHPPAATTATPTTALNMSNQEMDEQFYRLLGLFSEYMRSVQQDEDERHQRRRGSFDRSVSAGRRRGVENNDGFPDTSGGSGDEMQQQQHRISVDSLREFVNESMAAAGRRPSPQRRRPPSSGFPAALPAASRTTPATSRQQSEPSSGPVASAIGIPALANNGATTVASSPLEEGSSSSRSVLECTICLEDLQNGGDLQFLPCGHGFHSDCLHQWRSYSHRCPLCRDSTANIF